MNYNQYEINEPGQKYPWSVIEFENANDIVETVEKLSQSKPKPRSWYIDGRNSKLWQYGSLFKDLNTTKTHLINGSCPDGLVDVVEQRKAELYEKHPELYEFEKTAMKKKRKRIYSEEGSELNIDRYMSGEVEQWSKTQKVDKKRILRVVYNGAMLGNHSGDRFVRNMTTVCALLEIFTMAGLSTEFHYAAISTDVTEESYGTAVIIKAKDANENIDVSRILSLSSPGLFRYFVFNIRYQLAPGAVTEMAGISTYDVPDVIKEYKEFDVCVSANDSSKNIVNLFTDILNNL